MPGSVSNTVLPGQPEKAPYLIPVALGLLGPDGNDLDAVEAALSKPTMPGKPKAILAHTIGGLAAAFVAHWLYVLVTLI